MGFLSDVVGSIGDVFTGIGSVVDPVLGGISSAAKALAPAAPLIAPAAAYLGSQVTNEGNLDVAKQYSAASAEQAAINRQFQADMSNTSYQRSVKDLQAAGLNPMMAYSNGGASTPSGAQGVVQQVQMQNALGSAVDAYNQTAGQTSRSAADYGSAATAEKMVEQIQATTEKVKADIEKVKGDTNFATQQDILRQTAWSLHQSGAVNQERGMTEGQQRAVMQQTIKNLEKDGTLKQLDIDAAKALDNLGRTSKELQPIIQMLTSILRVK